MVLQESNHSKVNDKKKKNRTEKTSKQKWASWEKGERDSALREVNEV